MTAEQRAELLKRVFSDDPNKKFSFKDCEKIAKDLNLTLEQVSCFIFLFCETKLAFQQVLVVLVSPCSNYFHMIHGCSQVISSWSLPTILDSA